MLMLKAYSNFLADQNRVLGEMVEERSREVLTSYRETIETLSRAAGYKDEVTGSHVRRISYYTEELALALGMNAAFCETVAHDLALEVGQGVEDAAGDHVALNLGEPDFHALATRRSSPSRKPPKDRAQKARGG